MKQSVKAFCVGLALPSTLTTPAIAQTTLNSDTSVSAPTGQAANLRVQPRLGVGFTSVGACYSEPFFSIEGFTPIWQNPGQDLTFLEGRMLVSTDATMGGNLVLGKRFYNSSHDHILGGYIAYDIRDTGSNTFHQIGAGFERLGNWDLRINGYLPIGDRYRQLEESFSNPRFQQNVLLLDYRNRAEAAMAGVDIEAGGRLAKLGNGDLRGYAGVYYYDAPGSDSTLGLRGRLEVRPSENVQLGLTVQHDDLFDTKLVFNFRANLSRNRLRRVDRNRVLARIAESVERTAPITVDTQDEKTAVAVTNPKTGKPWQFRHVSLGSGTGNGTFENPTSTVQAALSVAQPEEIVYVQFSQNPGIEEFTIPDGVSVLSTAPIQRIDTEQVGVVQLPLSGSGQYPDVIGSVTMGNDTALSGFAITNIPGNGIQGMGIQDIKIYENLISNTKGQGISLINVSGENTITNNSINNSDEQESFVQNSGNTQQTLLIENNVISQSDRQGIFIQSVDNAQQKVIVNNNSINNSTGQSIFAQANGGSQQQVTIADTTINTTNLDSNGNGGQGLFLAANGDAQQIINLNHTNINNSAAQGVFVQGNGNSSNPATQVQQTLSSNHLTISNSGGTGFFTQANGNVLQEIALTQTTIQDTKLDANGNGGQSIFIAANGGATQNVRLDDANVSHSDAQGVFIQGNGDPLNYATQTQQTVTHTNVTITDSAGAGLFIQANGNVQQQITVANTTVAHTTFDRNGNGGQGIFIAAGGGAEQTINLNEIRVNDSANQGIFVQGNGDPSNPSIKTHQRFTIDNAQISNSSGAGIFVQANGNTQQDFTIANSTISSTDLDSNGVGGQGIFVQTNGNAQSKFKLRNNTFVDNADAAIFIQSNDASQMNADIESNTLQNNGTPGLNATMNSKQQLCLNLRGNNSSTGYLLQRNSGAFQVVDRNAVSTNNTGTTNFQPDITTFDNVPTCP